MLAGHGDPGRVFELASVTKPLAARAVHVAIEEGAVDLDTAAGPPGSTVRHLLAHTSGLSMHSEKVLAAPGARRIYSNQGFTVLGQTVERETGIDFARYLAEAVCEPLGMAATRLEGARWRPGSARRRPWRTWPRSPGPAAPGDGLGRPARRGHDRAVPRSGRRAARIRGAAAQRLGARIRAAGREIAALDRRAELGANIRPFRPGGRVYLGGSGHRARAGGADRPRIRGVGAAAVAGDLRRRDSRIQLIRTAH
ncbi:hypothetical protein I548_5093 [Mycobacterium intracellulare]|nr:hypothetical protein I548_5093 [Mycobacterium intracellulare]